MKLKIRNVGPNDFGFYRCVAKNSLGELKNRRDASRLQLEKVNQNIDFRQTIQLFSFTIMLLQVKQME